MTRKKILFAGLCVCGVILIIQPWMQLEVYNQNGTREKENLYTLNKTLCSVENSRQKINDEIGTTSESNIIPCDQNGSQSLKRPQINNKGTLGQKSSSARLMSVIVGYSAAVSHGIFLGLYVLVLKKNPYINKHPLETLFWVSILGTTVSLILMLLVETPVLPSNWFEFTMVIIHCVTCAAIWPLVMYGSGIITGNTVTINY